MFSRGYAAAPVEYSSLVQGPPPFLLADKQLRTDALALGDSRALEGVDLEGKAGWDKHVAGRFERPPLRDLMVRGRNKVAGARLAPNLCRRAKVGVGLAGQAAGGLVDEGSLGSVTHAPQLVRGLLYPARHPPLPYLPPRSHSLTHRLPCEGGISHSFSVTASASPPSS